MTRKWHMEVNDLAARYPRFFHMAERDTWQSIKANGLLSTTAVLDRYKLSGLRRVAIEEGHRPTKMRVGDASDGIMLRDQVPMPPRRLETALIDGTTPGQWYKFLNGRVFMWAQEERLLRLLKARLYRQLEHDVLTIDSAALLKDYADKVLLCRMNSGNTWPKPHPRGMDDFKRIQDYPTKPRGAPLKPVVEVVVGYSIPDIAKYVIEVRRMRGHEVLHNIPL